MDHCHRTYTSYLRNVTITTLNKKKKKKGPKKESRSKSAEISKFKFFQFNDPERVLKEERNKNGCVAGQHLLNYWLGDIIQIYTATNKGMEI